MNNFTRSLLEYLDDAFAAHPRMFVITTVCLCFAVAAIFD